MCIYIFIYIFFFPCYLPSCPNPRDWTQFPVLYSRTSVLIYSKCSSLLLCIPNSPSVPLPPCFFGIVGALGQRRPHTLWGLNPVPFSIIFLVSGCQISPWMPSLMENLLHLQASSEGERAALPCFHSQTLTALAETPTMEIRTWELESPAQQILSQGLSNKAVHVPP